MKKIVFTDLDRTLFTADSKISRRNYDSLVKLGDKGVLRVVVTGRNFHSANKALAPDFPIDYLVISSGAAIIDFRTREILSKQEIENQLVKKVKAYLQELDVDFMIHAPIPDNHFFEYQYSSKPCADAIRRVKINQEFATLSTGEYRLNASQFLSVVGAEKEHLVEDTIASLPDLSVIRATSPLDHKSVWIELFPAGIDKGYACRKIVKKLGLKSEEVLAIGNDYNDMAMLESFTDSFVVANAPELMKARFKVVEADSEDGFTKMLIKHFDFI